MLSEIIINAVMRTLTLSHAFFSLWVDVMYISDNTTPITISLRPGGASFLQSLSTVTVDSTAMIASASNVLRSMTHVVS